jgi:hypothetical protein
MKEGENVCTFTTVGCAYRGDIVAHHAAIVEFYRGYLFDRYWCSRACQTVTSHFGYYRSVQVHAPVPYYSSGRFKLFQFLFYNLDESLKVGLVRNDLQLVIYLFYP